MVKIVEYMAMSRSVVSYDLLESRRSAAEAALYAEPGSEPSFADAIERLLDDPERRVRMGRIARERVERELAWEHSARRLCLAYEYACRSDRPGAPTLEGTPRGGEARP
jgi:glycosyltransferase involved in cell wall biosynthesis